MKDNSVSSLEKDFCNCNFAMIMRDQKTQIPYCAQCKREVLEFGVSSPDKKVDEDRNIKEALAPKSEMSKQVDPAGYATAAVKILHALKLVIGQDVNEHAMPVLIQIMKNNIGNKPETETVLEQEERILCAAIWYKDIPLKKEIPGTLLRPVNIDCGVVFCGYRHPHALYTMVAVTGLRSVEVADDGVGRETQGFLTSENRFVDRREAARIHVRNGGKLNYSTEDLYSEDLY